MKTLFLVLADRSCRPFNLLTLSLILLISLANCSPAETVAPDTCECALTTGVVKDSASDGSTAEVKVDTCMEPQPCDPEDLEVTSFDEDSSQFTSAMKRELQDKGDVYALLDVKPDNKTWDPAIIVEVVLNDPAPRDNFSLSILRWTANDWKKEGTAIAAKKDDLTAEGEISHTSFFAFVDETADEVAIVPDDERVTIPDVAGLSQNEARQRLREEDLYVSIERRSDDDVEEGTVIRTNPHAGREVDSGSTVTLIVSSGPDEPDTVRVPDLIGDPVDSAATVLNDSGYLVAGQQIGVESSAAEGDVIEMDPAPGTEVDAGTTVTLYYAISEQPEPCQVPDLIGDPVNSAATVLNDISCLVAGQQIGVESPQAADDVIEMDPGPGTEVEAGTAVTLYYAIPEQPEPCEVPDVFGYYLDEAVDVLNDTGCLYAGEQIGVESPEPEWIVIDMSPGPGAEVDAGTAVTLYYAIPEQPEQCEVPDVFGYYLDEAVGVLNDTGCLYAGEQIGVESPEPEWIVIDMSPGPGAEVDFETAVTLYYAVPYESDCEVPDVFGYYIDEAAVVIDDTGCLYVYDQIGVESYEYEGTVIDMSPGPGEIVEYGTDIILYYAIPYEEECVMPYVAGDHIDDAVAAIDATGCLEIGGIYEVEPEYPYTEHNTVRYTEPKGGAILDYGTVVYLYVVVVEIEQTASDYDLGYDVGVSAANDYYASTATILYDSGSAFSVDRMGGFFDGFSAMGGEIYNTIPVNSDWDEILLVNYAAGLYPDVIYVALEGESASTIAEIVSDLNEEFGLEAVLFDAYGAR